MLITIPEDTSTANSRDQYHLPVGHSLSAPVRRLSHENQGRTQIVRLYRPPCGSYGFHLRGGREHETGFFISHVESGSEAYAQGLRTGDQLVRVNNMSVNHSLHNEVASIVKYSTEVLLEVKSAGLIPIKNNPQDQLAWMLIGDGSAQPNSLSTESQPASLKSVSSSSSSSSSSFSSGLVIINMKGAGKGTIGCSICKGPEDKPGIFVQKIHTGGIADEAGLRAGDQIFSCNGKSFLHIEFQEAVHYMKSSHCLKLEVLRGAGMDFIAGESSGYNSSISSESDEISDSDCRREKYYPNSKPRTITRVNSLYLDSNRDWKEIEAEWAEAEVYEKRSKLTVYNSQEPKLSSSKSLLNLSPSLEKKTGSLKPSSASKTGSLKPSTSSKTKLQRQSANIHRPRSMTNLSLLKHKDTFKIAFQTSDDPHVSKIVIPPPPKDERSAIMRLELLSAPSTLKKKLAPSLPPSSGPVTNIETPPVGYSSGSESTSNASNIPRQLVNIQSMKPQRLTIANKAFKAEGECPRDFRLNRGRTPPKECPTIYSEDSECRFPCSNICISSGSGKFTSKITIRSCPPTPPPRATSTRLTKERLHRCGHRQRLNSQQLSDSPPSSISSASSHEYPKCDHNNFSRQISTGSLSLSSDESGTWEESVEPFRKKFSSSSLSHRKTTPSPPKKPSTLSRVVKPSIKNIPIPPPPPPQPLPISNKSPVQLPPPSSIPPPPPLPTIAAKDSSEHGDSLASLSLSAALSKEIKARQEQGSNGLKDIRNAKLDEQRKPIPPDPKKQQHEQLMEEFKKAHANMFKKPKETSLPSADSIADSTDQ